MAKYHKFLSQILFYTRWYLLFFVIFLVAAVLFVFLYRDINAFLLLKEMFVKKLRIICKNTLEFVTAYGLKPAESSLKARLTVKAAFLWEEISGATFDRLKGYGGINEALGREYEKYTSSLTNLASDLMHITYNQDDN